MIEKNGAPEYFWGISMEKYLKNPLKMIRWKEKTRKNDTKKTLSQKRTKFSQKKSQKRIMSICYYYIIIHTTTTLLQLILYTLYI